MKNHSMIFDDFFEDPLRTKALINMMEARDEKYLDGVTYPNIAHLPQRVTDEIEKNLKALIGPGFTPVLSFARYGFKDVTPPHWAHSDRNIAQFLALIYLNDDRQSEKFGTVCLRHKALGFETHPEKDFERSILIGHANHKEEWEIVFTCPGRFNRCFILNADLIHAAVGEYGSRKEDGRLVISVFFNLENKYNGT